MNLQNLNLVELNAQEVELTNGGNGVYFAGTGVASAECRVCWSEFFRGFFGF